MFFITTNLIVTPNQRQETCAEVWFVVESWGEREVVGVGWVSWLHGVGFLSSKDTGDVPSVCIEQLVGKTNSQMVHGPILGGTGFELEPHNDLFLPFCSFLTEFKHRGSYV